MMRLLRKRFAVVVVLATLSVACGVSQPATSGSDAASATQVEQEPLSSSCLQQGGRISNCPMHSPVCVKNNPDGGRQCTDDSQCVGECGVRIIQICEPGGECEESPHPAAGAEAVGYCRPDNDPCDRWMRVNGGIAQTENPS